MAVREDFYSLKLTVSLPSNFEDWFPIWHLIPNTTIGKQITLIPQKYTPLNTFAVGEDITYNAPKPASATEDALSIALMMAASGGITGAAYGTALLAESFANSGTFSTAKRKDQTGFYFQIGDLKHQSYFKIAIEYLTSSVISSIEYATNSRLKKLYLAHGKIVKIRKEFNNIFYVTLYEFNEKPMLNFTPSGNLNVWSVDKNNKYVKYSLDLSQSQINENGELIFNKDITPDVEKILTGDFFTIDKPWILEDYALIFEYGLTKNNGFYETNNQKYKAFYEFGAMNIKGVWLQLPKEFTNADGSKETFILWKLFTDLNKEMFILPETEEDEKFFGENSEIGSFDNGFKQLEQNVKDGKTTTARVVIFGAGSKLENFYQPYLIGEYAKVGDYYFEIVNHPRLDTIEVQLKSVNGNVNFIDQAGSNNNVDVFQQKFWFVNDLYWGSALNWPIGLWQTDQNILSIAANDYKEEKIESAKNGERDTIYNIEWTDASGNKKKETKTITISSSSITEQDKKYTVAKGKTTNVSFYAYDVPSSTLGNEEKNNISCTFLTERFYKPYSSFKFETSATSTNQGTSNTTANSTTFGGGSSGGGGATRSWEETQTIESLTYGFYKKYKGWYFYNTGNSKTYKILDASFSNAKSYTTAKPLVEINLTLEGDLTAEFIVGKTSGYVFLGVPYPTYSGKHGEMSLYLSSASSLGISGVGGGSNYVYLYGNYYAGTYILSQEVPQFSMIGTTSYGDNVTMSGRNIANVQFSTYSANKNIFVSGVTEQIGDVSKEYLFFVEPQNLLLVYRSGSCAWRFNPQKKLVITIEPSVQNGTGGQKELEKTNKIITQIVYNAEKDCTYWYVRPREKVNPSSIYESYHISENSHADTNLTRLYGLETSPTDAIYFPFEFTSSINKDKDDKETATVTVDTYFKSSVIGTGECLEKIHGKDVNTQKTLTSLISGEPFNRGPLSFDIKSTSYVDPTKVLQNVNYSWPYSTKDGKIYLFYNWDPPDFYIYDLDGSPNKLNPSRPSVFALASNNSGSYFYNPIVARESEKNGTFPLMLLYDFDFRAAVINGNETTCFLFGFTYDRGYSPADKDKDGKFLTEHVYSKHCFLAMYCFNLNDIFTKDAANLVNVFANKDNSISWTGRRPILTAKPSSKPFCPLWYGKNKNVFGHLFVEEEFEDYYDFDPALIQSSQYVVSILDQEEATFLPQHISVTIDASGVITLFVEVQDLLYKDKNNKNQKISGIVSLVSKNNGLIWLLTADDNNVPIIYNDNEFQTNPYQLGELLFLIDKKSQQLVVKNLETKITKGIADDILPQKIYATMKENGLIYVYYIVNGNVVASFSNDSGITWQYLTNW